MFSNPRQILGPLRSFGSTAQGTLTARKLTRVRRMASTNSAAPATAHNYAPRAGFDDSGASGLYHAARPDYPPEAIQSILRAAQSSASSGPAGNDGLSLLEIGSGTGISTRSLLETAAAAKGQVKVQRYLAVEPSHGMRKDWDKNILTELLPKLQSSGLFAPAPTATNGAIGTSGAAAVVDLACVDGTFEDLSSALTSQEQHQKTDGATAAAERGENIYDLCLIAQAWHWCPDIPRSLEAIARALKRGGQQPDGAAAGAGGGHLALIWNLENQDTKEGGAPWVAQARSLYEVFEDGTPQYRHRYWSTMYDERTLHDNFEVLEPQYYYRTLPTTVQGVKDRVLSKSYISVLPQEKRDELMGKIDAIFHQPDELTGRVWIDKEAGVFEYPYRTELLLFRRK